MTPRRRQLQSHTQAVHEALHRQSPFVEIAAGAFTRAEVDLMRRLHERCWSTYARRDRRGVCLSLFGTPAAQLFNVSCADADAGSGADLTSAAALGAAYVYLGSRFGGAILAKSLAQSGYEREAATMRMRPLEEDAWRRLWPLVDALSEVEFEVCLGEAARAFEAFRLQPAPGLAHA